MELIDKNQYTQEQLIGKRFFIHKSTKNDEIYYIFIVKSIEDDFPITYNTTKQYSFCIPNDNRVQCFCYDNNHKIIIENKYDLYQISENEYLDLFRKFVKNDGKNKYEINIDFFN